MSCSVTLRVTHAGTKWGEILAVVGATDALGNWSRPLPMTAARFPDWTITITDLQPQARYEYKYVLMAAANSASSQKSILVWEDLPQTYNRGNNNRSFVAADGLCVNDVRWGTPRNDAIGTTTATQAPSAPSPPTADPLVTAVDKGTLTDPTPATAQAQQVHSVHTLKQSPSQDPPQISPMGKFSVEHPSTNLSSWTQAQIAEWTRCELNLAADNVRESRARLRTSLPRNQRSPTALHGHPSVEAVALSEDDSPCKSSLTSEEALCLAQDLIAETKISVQEVRSAVVAAARSAAASGPLKDQNGSTYGDDVSHEKLDLVALIAFVVVLIAVIAGVIAVDPIARLTMNT